MSDKFNPWASYEAIDVYIASLFEEFNNVTHLSEHTFKRNQLYPNAGIPWFDQSMDIRDHKAKLAKVSSEKVLKIRNEQIVEDYKNKFARQQAERNGLLNSLVNKFRSWGLTDSEIDLLLEGK